MRNIWVIEKSYGEYKREKKYARSKLTATLIAKDMRQYGTPCNVSIRRINTNGKEYVGEIESLLSYLLRKYIG